MAARFPLKELERHCGLESGDWATMSTTLAQGHKAYAVAHRRGGSVSACPYPCCPM